MAENDSLLRFRKPGIMASTPKFCTQVLVFGQDKWIMRNIANAYPHVDRIYIAYSEKPWTYNPNARNQYKNSFDLDVIRKSPYMDKITLIVGEWSTEEEQRNVCVQYAKNDGMDYMIIHDADEFYFHGDFEFIKGYIVQNPDHDYYKIAWYCFWKSFNHILLDEHGKEIVGYPEFAINLKRDVRFESKRRPNKKDVHIIPPEIGICYHGSYVLSNEELLTKLNTWGHTNDFDKQSWFSNKWFNWVESDTNLHLVHPPAWSKAMKFTKKLPEVIEDMK